MSTFGIFDRNEIDGLLNKYKAREAKVKQELANAINKAARVTINESIKEWDAMLTARGYMDDKKSIDIVAPATTSRTEAKIHARNRATRADRFKYQQLDKRQGVDLNMKRGSGGGVIKKGFVVNAKSNNKPLILERIIPYRKGEPRNFRGGRFKAIYGPSVNQFFTDSSKRVQPEAMSEAKKQFLQALNNG